MGATLATVSNITKEVYGPRIVDQLENEIVLTKRIEKSSAGVTSDVGGKYVTFPLKVRRNNGIGYRNELEQLQAPGQQGYASVRVPLRYGYGRVHLSGQTMELVNDNSNAFATAISEEMTGLKEDIKKDTNRILWGDGLGVCATVDTAAGPVNTISVGTGSADLHWLDLDMQIDILSSDGATTKASNRKITAINDSTGDITIDGAAATVAVGDIITRTGNYGREPNGLTSLVKASGALFNLDPATEPKWKSLEDNTGGAISESKMTKMCDDLRSNGGRPSLITTDLASRRSYVAGLQSNRRIVNTRDFSGGFTGVAFAYDEDIPVVTDIDAPAGKMWFLREEDFTVYQSGDWAWEDRDGSTWKWVVDYDAYQALMKKYWEFGLKRRNTQGVMTGITPG